MDGVQRRADIGNAGAVFAFDKATDLARSYDPLTLQSALHLCECCLSNSELCLYLTKPLWPRRVRGWGLVQQCCHLVSEHLSRRSVANGLQQRSVLTRQGGHQIFKFVALCRE